MNTLAEFKPIVPDKKQEMLEYYRSNNIPVPDNQYFRDYFDIKPKEIEQISTESSTEEESPKRKAWDFSEFSVPEITKTSDTSEKTKTISKEVAGNKNQFFGKFWDAAKKASQKSGIPAETLLAISALETGYGKSMPGNMVAGIKADSGHKGKTQDLITGEVINGKPIKQRAKFRAYNSTDEAFEDFGNFFAANPRYQQALGSKDPYKAAKEIASAGYATDPEYYNKIKSILDDILA